MKLKLETIKHLKRIKMKKKIKKNLKSNYITTTPIRTRMKMMMNMEVTEMRMRTIMMLMVHLTIPMAKLMMSPLRSLTSKILSANSCQ